MIENNVFCLRLTRMQFHTLHRHFSNGFSFYQLSADPLDNKEIKKILKL